MRNPQSILITGGSSGLGLIFLEGLVIMSLTLACSSMAQTIWSGFDVSFTKPDTGDVNDPANQDRITDNVWLTRGGTGGIYNINQESFYATNISPTDTEWATEVVPENEGEPIVATNWEDLTFTDWRTSYGGMFALLENIILVPAVVHLITDDVYLEIIGGGREGPAVQVEVTAGEQLSVSVADNGRGFPVSGKFTHADLTAGDFAPRTLLERVTALRGLLALESSPAGARLDIALPYGGRA